MNIINILEYFNAPKSVQEETDNMQLVAHNLEEFMDQHLDEYKGISREMIDEVNNEDDPENKMNIFFDLLDCAYREEDGQTYDLFIDYSFASISSHRTMVPTGPIIPLRASISGAIFGAGIGYRF